MEKLTGIMATTHVNRRNDRFTREALEKAAEDTNASAGLPQLVNHDWTRVIGWTDRLWIEPMDDGEFALHFEASMPETVGEEVALRERFRRHVIEMQEREIESHMEGLRSSIGPEGLAVFVFDCVGIVQDGIAMRLCPNLATPDSQGLVSMSRLNPIARGLFVEGDLVLAPHWMMRRYGFLLNSMNDALVGTLKKLDSETELSCRIRLDPNFIGLKDSLRNMGECDYWWGPPFTGELRDHPEGVLVHGADERLRVLEMLNRAEMFLYRRNKETIVQIEELHQPQIVRSHEGEDYAMERYAHLVVDAEGQVVHLDGSVRLYTQEVWQERQQSNVTISNAPRASHRVKMFSVDGRTDQQTAFGVLNAYFRGNPLVAEIFGIDMEDAVA